jgi:hypothetical protein
MNENFHRQKDNQETELSRGPSWKPARGRAERLLEAAAPETFPQKLTIL